MLLDLVTIIIPTYNRHNYLKRILEYYNSFNHKLKIIIADSSVSDIYDSDLKQLLKSDCITYLKFHSDIIPLNKCREALNLVESKYVVFCADDDFIIPNAIERSAEYLEAHNDYSCAQGLFIAFKYEAGDSKSIKLHWELSYKSISISDDDATERLSKHLYNYEPTWYGVHKTSQLKLALQEASKLPIDYRFGEIVLTALTSIMGKIKILNILYCAREINKNSAGQTMLTWYDWMAEKQYKDKYTRIKNCFAGYLSKQSNITFTVAEQEVDMILKNFLVKNAGRNCILRANSNFYDSFYKISKLILKKISLLQTFVSNYKAKKMLINIADEECYKRVLDLLINPHSPFYQDFQKIEQSILK